MIDTHTTIKPILKYPGAKSGFQATDYNNRLRYDTAHHLP